jgi:hypothetical protein
VNVKVKQITQQTVEKMSATARGENPPSPPPAAIPQEAPAKLNEEEKVVTQKFEETMKAEEPPAVSDAQVTKNARKKIQERMDALSRMYLKAETGEIGDEDADDDHVIEED